VGSPRVDVAGGGGDRDLRPDRGWATVAPVWWLDLPRGVASPCREGRTVRRGLRREAPWSGSRERSLRWVRLRWAGLGWVRLRDGAAVRVRLTCVWG